MGPTILVPSESSLVVAVELVLWTIYESNAFTCQLLNMGIAAEPLPNDWPIHSIGLRVAASKCGVAR